MHLSFTLSRRVSYSIVVALLIYLVSYALLRASGVLLHIGSGMQHDIREVGSSGFPNAYSPLEIIYAPLRGVEYLYWIVVQL